MTAGKSSADPIRSYLALAAREPQLFAGRERRRIVLDPGALDRYSAEHGTELGVLTETPFYYVLNDLVESEPNTPESRFAYTRIVRKGALNGVAGAAAFATIARPDGSGDDVVLVRQDRHATGRTELELPRGFGSPGESVETVALRELAEETGFTGAAIAHLGDIAVDSGIDDGVIGLVHIAIDGLGTTTREPTEVILDVVQMPLDALRTEVARGAIRDSFTLAALCIYLARRSA